MKPYRVVAETISPISIHQILKWNMRPTNTIKSNITGKRVTLCISTDGSYDFAVLIICCHIWNTIINTAAYRWVPLLMYLFLG